MGAPRPIRATPTVPVPRPAMLPEVQPATTLHRDTDVRAWIGRTARTTDDLAPTQARAAAAMLDAAPPPPAVGDELPPLWHWFHFLPNAPQARLGDDGHPPRGDFLPPIPYPRRMFAGARVRVLRPLRLGRPAERTGTVRDVVLKEGRSGRLAFVTVDYAVEQDGVRCLEETQDIVYREPGPPVPAPVPVAAWPAVADDAWTRVVTPDPRLLFRFSALTFNAHRIHYDRDWARDAEGYPGLVVHGPLTALLLLELARARMARPVVGFEFRGVAPLFDLAPFRLVATPDGDDAVALRAEGPDGATALTARAVFG